MSAIATSAIGSASRHGNKSRAPKSQPKEAETAAPASIIMARRCDLFRKRCPSRTQSVTLTSKLNTDFTKPSKEAFLVSRTW